MKAICRDGDYLKAHGFYLNLCRDERGGIFHLLTAISEDACMQIVADAVHGINPAEGNRDSGVAPCRRATPESWMTPRDKEFVLLQELGRDLVGVYREACVIWLVRCEAARLEAYDRQSCLTSAGRQFLSHGPGGYEPGGFDPC